jgi:DHA1 family inner membrane transport protein
MLAIGMFAMGTDNFVVAGILGGVASSLHVSVSAAGQMVTVYALSFAILAPVMAVVGGNWPRKAMLVSALALFVVGNVITALASNIVLVLASRAIAGLGAAMFSPTALGAATAIVSPERRGRALSIVTAGLSGATALGAPLGTFIGALGDWRTTLWFVAAIGLASMVGVMLLLRAVPQPAPVTMRQRLAPLADSRINLTLLTTLFAYGGFLVVYTYSGLVLDRVTHGDGRVLAGLLLIWGIAATCGNLVSGRLVDRFESRRVINTAIVVAIVNFCLLPFTSAHLATALLSLCIWACFGWGLMVPLQHRLVKSAPHVAPLVLAWYNSAVYGGLACAGVLGGVVILLIDPHYLSLVGAASLSLAFLLAELAHARIVRREHPVRVLAFAKTTTS